jgi:type II secretory pathway predicted ATPase ExeA
MFLDFYQLKEQPFGVTPNPDFLYLGEQYREALASMVYAVRSGRGFHALIAPPGLGKTTLLFRFMNHLRDTHKCVFLFNTLCNQREFLRLVLADLEIVAPGQDIVEMQSQLNDFLVRTAQEGKSLVLIVDEAQNLSDDVLEMIRLFSNFETPCRKLMHIVLAGQPQLEAKLSQPHLAQLRQRISFITRLKPLRREQVHEYVHWRLNVAGAADRHIFGPGAVDLIAEQSQGVPRNINNLCFHALSLGFAKGKSSIGREIAAEVIADNSIAPEPRSIAPTSVESIEAPVFPHATKRLIPPPADPLAIPIAKPERRAWPLSQVAIAICAGATIAIGTMLILRNLPQRETNASELPTAPITIPAKHVVQTALPIGKPSNELVTSLSAEKKTETIDSAAASDPAVEKKDPASSSPRTVVVQANETLWEISRREFPDVPTSDVIDAILGTNTELRDPNHVLVGQIIVLPAPEELDFSTVGKSTTSSTRSKP